MRAKNNHNAFFDFGMVLGGSSHPLRHEYPVIYRMAVDWEVEAVNAKPCCGVIKWIGPPKLAAGASGILQVVLKVRTQIGLVQHNALIRPARPGEDEIRFTTVANVLPRLSITEEAEPPVVVASGETRRRTFEVTRHGEAGEDGIDLHQAKLRSEFPVAWVTEVTTRPLTAAISEQKRSFAVELSGGAFEGQRSASVGIMDRGTLILSQNVTWASRLAIQATPATLTISAAQPAATVLIRTRDDRPFRVLNATTDLAGIIAGLTPSDAEPSRNHRLQLHVAQGTERVQIGRLRVETDHPDQPIVHVAIMQQP